jgi:hypothetical protein
MSLIGNEETAEKLVYSEKVVEEKKVKPKVMQVV